MNHIIRCGNCGATHPTVAVVRACNNIARQLNMDPLLQDDFTPPGKLPPTEKQINFAQKLLHERVPVGHANHLEVSDGIESAEEYVNGLTRQEVSGFIADMLKQPEREDKAKSGKKIQVEEGIYLHDGIYYKVQRAVHGSGHLYAKQWDVDNKKFEFASGALSRLSVDDQLGLEEAKEFGKIYGVCCVCGKTLTDEDSITAGIGPVCGKEYGDVDRQER